MSGTEALKAWRDAGGEVGPRLNPLERAAANPTSRSLAISAKCFDCSGGDADPGWRWRIGNCSVACPLVPVWPYRHLEGTPMPLALEA